MSLAKRTAPQAQEELIRELGEQLTKRDKLIAKMEEHLGCPNCYAPVILIRDDKGDPDKLFCPTCIWEKNVCE